MCVEERGLMPAQMLGGIPAAAAAEGLTSCSLGSCNVQPSDLALRVAALSQLRAISSKLSQGSTERITGKQKRVAEK